MARPRILVTRSPHQASALAEALRALGAEPVLLPTIELAEPTSFSALDDAILRMDTFHWLLFTSANAVEAFCRRGRATALTDQRIAAIGLATGRALEAAGLRADLVPPLAIAESLADALLPFVRRPDGHPTNFLLVRAEKARDHLPDALRAAGAEVTIAPAYQTIIPGSSVSGVQALFKLRENWPDAISFTSSSTAANLLALLDLAGVKLPAEILRVSIGPVTSQTLREAGYAPHAEAIAPTISELAKAITDAVTLKSRPDLMTDGH
jgi:uroporphyrinogen-III synthase